MSRLLRVDAAAWVEAIAGQEDFLKSFGESTPLEIWEEHNELARRIQELTVLPGDTERDSWE